MLNALLLLLGLLSPFAGGMQATADLPVPSTARLALWQPSFPAQAADDTWGKITSMDSFDSMDGITLYDDYKSVLSKKGEPDSADKDPYTGYTEFRYDGLTIGLYEGLVYYVHTGPSPEKMSLNGISIPLQEVWLRHYFGEPDFVAEDGDVYIRGNAALKVYRDPLSGEVTGVDLFDDAAS
ncbi:hypothetical protein QYF50_09525 [Paenibacillus vini]|uniref:hypothetical protein n=1 Tax=Paenibacillus vini TaxID=1476024 RepID=UPI0025B69579|nr:hypothetical protein [Paenibacillus vini]MDN4068124.1 hypothetical protein [Paenibacillus vini]